jgi:peroxiredoxin
MQARKLSLQSIRRWSLLAAALVILASCNYAPDSAKVKSESTRKATPDFNLKDATGANVKLSDYKGKVVLLNFWATWCGPCKVEIPWFMDFEKTYKDRDFAVLGVSMDEDGWDAVKPYIKDHKMNYRVVLGNDEVSQLFGNVDSLPTTLMIDRQGRVASMHVGLVSKRTYEKEIEELLKAPKNGSQSGAVRAPGGVFAFVRAN